MTICGKKLTRLEQSKPRNFLLEVTKENQKLIDVMSELTKTVKFNERSEKRENTKQGRRGTHKKNEAN